MDQEDELNNYCVYLRTMGFKGSIRLVKYVIVCLVFVFISKAESFMCHDSAAEEIRKIPATESAESNAITVEIRNHESNLIRNENSAFSVPETQCRIPRQSNFSISFRTFSQAGRNSANGHSRTGFAMMKSGKSMNEYTTSLFFKSILDFPSGLSESNHHLISLRKLLI